MDNRQDKTQFYKRYEKDRKKYIENVIESNSSKKIVAAGPGTGKTFLFQEICNKKDNKNNLVLTFINELVRDLQKDLEKVAEVRTLHSFAKKILKSNFFMELTEIIEEDFLVIKNKKISFKKIFSNLEEGYNNKLNFYSKRRKYYAHFGPHCSIYTLLKIFDQKEKIPLYSQILIDEFQDFNKLEIRLIDLLSEKSPILLVGDDDQSLYKFKFANPNEIREKHSSKEFERFELPYSSRCPKVIVDSVNNIVDKARQSGFLKNRIEKNYKYFHSESKDKISNENPQIIIEKQIYETMLVSKIDREIQKIKQKDKNFSVLIICTLYSQIARLEKRLRSSGYNNIQAPKVRQEMEKIEGYKLLLKEENSNLGWRIVSKYILDEKDFKEAINKSYSNAINFKDLIKDNKKQEIFEILKILKKIQKSGTISVKEAEKVLKEFKYNPIEISLNKIKDSINNYIKPHEWYKNISIKITTLLGSKGLTSDYIFLVCFDDRFILEKGHIITDENICKFIVALTRARKKVYIYSAENKIPTFVSWLNKDFYNIT